MPRGHDWGGFLSSSFRHSAGRNSRDLVGEVVQAGRQSGHVGADMFEAEPELPGVVHGLQLPGDPAQRGSGWKRCMRVGIPRDIHSASAISTVLRTAPSEMRRTSIASSDVFSSLGKVKRKPPMP